MFWNQSLKRHDRQARNWQLKHYLSYRLKTDENILPWDTVYSDWQKSLNLVIKDCAKIVPKTVSGFCKDLVNVCDTFEGSVVRQSCENLYTEFYQRNVDSQIVERHRLLEATIFSEQNFAEFMQSLNKKRIGEDIGKDSSSDEKRARSNEYNGGNFPQTCDTEELDESETCSQESSTILNNYKIYRREVINTLSENGIVDLSPTSEFVLLYLEEAEYDTLIKEVFDPIDKIFPKEGVEFLTDFFSKKLSEQQWEDKIENLMKVDSEQTNFIIKLKKVDNRNVTDIVNNPLKNKEMTEEEYMNIYIHPVLKKALIRFSDIRYVPGNKAIKASAYRKTVMKQRGAADRADGIAYTSNSQNSYEISITEGSRPYVTDKNKESSDFIQNARAAKDLINFAVTQEVLRKRPLPSHFRTFMVQVIEFNLRFYLMDYRTQYCIFEIETCEISSDWNETLQFTSFYRAIITWALLVGEADKKFQESRNKKSSRLSNCHNIRKLLKLSHNNERG
ncbi:15419_t:CDS:10, partial [Dentiscutata erythropus]